MKGVLSWLVRWVCRAGTRDICSALAALVGQIQNNFFLTVYTISIPFSPSHSKLGTGPAAVMGRLSLTVCLCSVAVLCINHSESALKRPILVKIPCPC
jgi:hypothetical protein